jgi:hypothetical protein
MTITTRENVRACVERAMQLDEHTDLDAAVQAVAAALCLPVEAVREVVEPCGGVAS